MAEYGGGFFSKMTKQMLNGIRVSSKEELKERMYKYFEEINKVPVPYHWKFTYKLDDIDLEKEDISQIVYEFVNHKAASYVILYTNWKLSDYIKHHFTISSINFDGKILL